jgi:hypothetical protein
MSEPLAERLSHFTPDGSSLDRDALLFAAGQASVRPVRRWAVLTGALAASQLLTLLLLWPRTPLTTPLPPTDVPLAIERNEQSAPPDPSALWSLRERALALEGDLPAPAADHSSDSAEPPLRAFASLPAALLN